MSNIRISLAILFFSLLSIGNITAQNIIIDEFNNQLNNFHLSKIAECDVLIKKSEQDMKNAIEIGTESTESNEAKLKRISSEEYSLEASIEANKVYFEVLTNAPYFDTDLKNRILKNIEEAKTELEMAKESFVQVKKNIKSSLRTTTTSSVITYLNTIQRMQNLALEKQYYAINLYIKYSYNQLGDKNVGTDEETDQQ